MSQKKATPPIPPPHLSAARRSVIDQLAVVLAARWSVKAAEHAALEARTALADALRCSRLALVAAGLDRVVYAGELVTVTGGSAGVEPSLVFVPAPVVLGGAA